jgi:hypothetical protein
MMTRDQLQQLVSMLWVAFKDQAKQQDCPEELLKFLAVGKIRSLQVHTRVGCLGGGCVGSLLIVHYVAAGHFLLLLKRGSAYSIEHVPFFC